MAAAPLLSAQLREAPGLSKTQIALDRRGLELSNLNRQSSDVRTSCQGEVPELLSAGALLRPCARAFQDFNQPRLSRVLPFGLIFTLLCLPLLLLPARRGWRHTLMAAAIFAPPVLFVWALSRWIAVSPRYVLQMMGPVAAVVPVALASLIRTLLPKPRAGLGTAITGLGLGAWVLTIGPQEREAAVPLEASATYTMTSPIIRYIRDELAESDLLLDCSESHIEAAVLPRQLHSPPSNHEGLDWRRCAWWIDDPPASEGTRWVITGQRTQLDQAPAGQLQLPWVRALHTDGVGHHLDLWRWQGQ
jgi:energy-converting hydrogenase Eha subunit A